MRKQFAKGTLWWLLKEMPKTLKTRLDKELEALDDERRKSRQKGDTKVILLGIHLRWMAEHQADLTEMKMALFPVLSKYIPITYEMVYSNQLPSLSDCTFFWGRQLKSLEKHSTLTTTPA